MLRTFSEGSIGSIPSGYAAEVVISVLLTLLLLRFLKPMARRLGLVDRPGGRKDHIRPTPTIGGVAMAVAAILAIFIAGDASQAFIAFAVGAVALIGIGWLDDIYDVRWQWRVLAEMTAALIIIYWGEVRVDYVGRLFGGGGVDLGVLAVPFSMFATVGAINAINMCDGSDGLAGCLCLAALMMLTAAALYTGNAALFADLLPFIAAIAIFLTFNLRMLGRRRAGVFMGNAGSAFLGLVIAWAAFRLTQNSDHPVSPVLAPWLVAPPLVDCLTLIVRRIRQGRSPFSADHDHMHHLLLEAGFTPTQIALGLAGASCALGGLAAWVLQTVIGTEVHLVLGFIALTLGYYWLTARRARAVDVFTRLHEFLRSRLRFLVKRETG